MSLWELEACAAGYARANGAGEKPTVSDDQMEKLEALGERWNKEARDGAGK